MLSYLKLRAPSKRFFTVEKDVSIRVTQRTWKSFKEMKPLTFVVIKRLLRGDIPLTLELSA